LENLRNPNTWQKMIKKLAVIFLVAVSSAHAATSGMHLNIAGRDVAVWKPAGDAPASGYPLIP